MTEPNPTLEVRFREFFKIVSACVFLSVVYGILHDLVTAHVQVEYFTEWHPTIIASKSPLAMAILWGVIATWWMGAFFGGIIATVSVYGNKPILTWRHVVPKVAGLLLTTLLLAYTLLFGLMSQLVGSDPSKQKDQRLMCILITHNFSYFFCALAALGLCAWTIWKRKRMMRL